MSVCSHIPTNSCRPRLRAALNILRGTKGTSMSPKLVRGAALLPGTTEKRTREYRCSSSPAALGFARYSMALTSTGAGWRATTRWRQLGMRRLITKARSKFPSVSMSGRNFEVMQPPSPRIAFSPMECKCNGRSTSDAPPFLRRYSFHTAMAQSRLQQRVFRLTLCS